MKVTIFFWLWILSVCCVFSCTDEDQGLDNIISDVATAPVKLSLGMTPMQENGSMTRVCGENSLDLVLGEEMGKVADSAETRAETLTDAQENVVNDICVLPLATSLVSSPTFANTYTVHTPTPAANEISAVNFELVN